MIWWALADAAYACSVCGGGATEESKLAFIVTTVGLSLLPLGLIGSVSFYVYRANQGIGPAGDGAASLR